MSHLMKYVSKLVNRQETLPTPISNLDSKPAKQHHTKATGNGEWWILEPPRLTLWDLIGDLKLLWRKEFLGASWFKKIVFGILRVIQHIAYRQGYGNDRMVTQLPTVYHPDFSVMEKNLEQIPREKRMAWLHSFLGYRNNPEKGKRLPLPSSVILELSNTCNYNCVGCGIGKNGVQADRFMDVENLRRWATSSCAKAKLIRINGLGEATIHPQLFECLDILANYPGGREIITNGSASMEVYERLLADGFVILISWDASEPNLFEKIRRGANFEAMRLKLPCIAAEAKRQEVPEPVLLFTFRESNMHQLEGTLVLAAEAKIHRVTVNMFKQQNNSDWTIPHRQRIREILQKAEELALRLDIDLALPDHIGEEHFQSVCPHHSFAKCPFPFEQVVIRYNGDLTPCNMMNPYIYGNIVQSDFENAWNSPEAMIFREFSGTCFSHSYCSYCYYVPQGARRCNQEKQENPELIPTGKETL